LLLVFVFLHLASYYFVFCFYVLASCIVVSFLLPLLACYFCFLLAFLLLFWFLGRPVYMSAIGEACESILFAGVYERRRVVICTHLDTRNHIACPNDPAAHAHIVECLDVFGMGKLPVLHCFDQQADTSDPVVLGGVVFLLLILVEFDGGFCYFAAVTVVSVVYGRCNAFLFTRLWCEDHWLGNCQCVVGNAGHFLHCLLTQFQEFGLDVFR
jgi:hypothetical protein